MNCLADNLACAAARPLIADPKAYSRRDRDGPCVNGSELARRIFTSQAWCSHVFGL